MDLSLILLTYKGKILLTSRETDLITVEKSPWCFIYAPKEKNKPLEETIRRRVEKETSIKLDSVEFLSSCDYKDKKRHFYHAQLSDKNVNNITRSEGRLIQFFTVKELEKLSLTLSSRLLVLKHKRLLELQKN